MAVRRAPRALCVVLLFAPALSHAQATDEPAVAGEDRGTASTPWWRSTHDSSRRLLASFNNRGLFPQVKSIADGTGLAPGLVDWRPQLGNTGLSFYASLAHSLEGDDLKEIRFGRIPHLPKRPPRRGDHEVLVPSEMGENGFFYYVQARQRDLTGRELFVPAALNLTGSPITYRNKDSQYDAVGGYRFSPRLSAAVRAGLLRNEVGGGDRPLPDSVEERCVLSSTAGLSRQPDYYRSAAVLSYDDRDMPRNAHEGAFVALTLGRFTDRAQGAFSFNRVTLDARRFQSLGSRRHVLAVRFLTSQSFSSSGARVPFYLQDTLGGNWTMRGYPSFRFRGDKVLTLSSEYRFEATPRIEIAAFYDAGKAWDNAGFSLTGMKGTYGLGFRVKTLDSVLLRLDVGKGSEGTRAHLALGYAF